MTPRFVTLLQCSLCLLVAQADVLGSNTEQTHLSECHSWTLTDRCVASLELEYSRSQLSLLQTVVQVDPNTLPLESYDYGFPTAAYGDIAANEFGYVRDDASVGVPRSAAVSKLPVDAKVNALSADWLSAELAELASLKEPRILDLPAVRHGKQILDTLRADGDNTVGTLELEQLSTRTNATMGSWTSFLSNAPFAPTFFLIAIGIGCFLSCLVYECATREQHHFHHHHHGAEREWEHKHHYHLGADIMFGLRICSCCYWLLILIAAGGYILWTLNIIQPILNQAICMFYMMTILLLASVLLLIIVYLEIRNVVMTHIHHITKAVHKVHDKFEQFEDTIEGNTGGCFPGKDPDEDDENTMKATLPHEDFIQKQKRCCS